MRKVIVVQKRKIAEADSVQSSHSRRFERIHATFFANTRGASFQKLSYTFKKILKNPSEILENPKNLKNPYSS